MNGCAPSRKEEEGYESLVLSANQMSTLAEVVELIIPTTDTPGAKVAGVHQYIDRVLAKVRSEEDLNVVKNGLDQLSNDDFLSVSNDERIVMLTKLQEKDDPFFSYG